MTVTGWAGLVLGLLVAGLAVVAAVRVPWTSSTVPRADQLAALARLPVEQVTRARAYRGAQRLPSYAALVLGLVVALALGLTPAGARLVDLVARPFAGHWLAAAVLGGLAVIFAGRLATLALSARGHAVAVRYGLSTQSWPAWLGDLLKASAVTGVIAAAALAAFFTLTRLLPGWWWAVAAACAAGLVVLLSFVFPVLVEPLFARFTPMPAGDLRTGLMALAARDGLPVRDVLIADASRRTTAVNAYVSGLGPTRRIVLYDTLLAGTPPAQVLGVVAHELAHARHRDVATGTSLGALAAAAAVVALYLLGQWDGLLGAAGVSSVGEPPAVALLVAVTVLLATLTGPLRALVSRQVEARADAHALALTGDRASFEALHARLAGANLADPDPPRWERALASHPSTVERMAAAWTYPRGEI